MKEKLKIYILRIKINILKLIYSKKFIKFIKAFVLVVIFGELTFFLLYLNSPRSYYQISNYTLNVQKGINLLIEEKFDLNIKAIKIDEEKKVTDIIRNIDNLSLSKEVDQNIENVQKIFSKADINHKKNSSISFEGPVEISECIDCKYYPVDKQHALSSKYIPQKLVSISVRGSGLITKETNIALQKLFEAAEKKGVKPKINSAYRSYQTQVNTFNYWVNKEIGRGKSRIEAEKAANEYSARPGHSEHQLGTTVDIGAYDSPAFDKKANANKSVWNFLKTHAHKYGFVISYPENSKSRTGYIYEPWHIRFIGKDLANELYKEGYLEGKGDYVNEFLHKKQMY